MAKGISVHIGINEVDPYKYPLSPRRRGGSYVVLSDEYDPLDFDCTFWVGWKGPLSSCELDADNMCELARKQRFRAKTLKTEQATAGNVIKEIKKAANSLVAGDTFLMTYSGHGAQVEDLSGDEWDGEDETWCLYDRMFLDDEQRELYARFRKGVKILVMSDSCHSGSATRSGESTASGQPMPAWPGEVRQMEERTALNVYKGRKKEYDQIQRSLKNPPPKLKASRILFAACQDHEHAMGYSDGGVFTVALLKVWNGGRFTGTYQDLAREIRDELQRNYNKKVDEKRGDASSVFLQIPNFVRIQGASKKALDNFVNSRPFEI